MFDEIFNENNMIDLQKILKENKQTITCAESCTGGLIASMITQIPGSSSVFRGSIVTYCNDIKETELNVSKDTMIKYGVVSHQVVKQMASGVLDKFDANFALSVSGIAGPDGGSEAKPVGMICYAIANQDEIITNTIYLKGPRKSIQFEASKTILKEIYKFIQISLDK
jgi:nicotinamide-nucleotide amidase